MTHITAMRLALEALINVRGMHYTAVIPAEKAITALQSALAEPKDDYEVHMEHCNQGEHEGCCKYGEADCPALAEPSEPVYWQWRRKAKPWATEYIFNYEALVTTDDSEVRKLYAHPPVAEPSEEPVLYINGDDLLLRQLGHPPCETQIPCALPDQRSGYYKTPLYLHPPVHQPLSSPEPYDPIGAWNKGFEEGKRLATPEPSEPVAFDATIDDDNALALLRDMVVQEDGDLTPIRMLVGGGHSGYGLYIAAAEYQDEGAILLLPMAPAHPPVPPSPLSAGEIRRISIIPRETP
jgi:hypothetical protein